MAPDMAGYVQRRTSYGTLPMPAKLTPRRTGMSPTIGPGVVRPRYDQENVVVNGTVRMVDLATGPPLQFANVQQWAHGVQGPQADQSLNSPPSNGGEYPRVNRANSSASLTPSSDSSLAGWNSTEDLHRFGQQAMEMQSPVGEAAESWPQWTTMSGEPSMMQQSLNGGFDPSSLAGSQYSPTVGGGMPENGFFQEALVLNGQAQSPKQFGPANGMVVSPPPGIQTQPPVWGQHALPASMGLQQ